MRLSCMRLGQRDAVDVPAVDAGRAVQHGRADGPSLSGYDFLTGLILITYGIILNHTAGLSRPWLAGLIWLFAKTFGSFKGEIIA